MEVIEPEFRFGLGEEQLAELFNYPLHPEDRQDWTYIVSEPERVDEYVASYNTAVTDPDTKFSLMEMIFQAVNDQPTTELMNEKWKAIEPLLFEEFELHKYTVFYWCSWENENINDCWEIAPLMREFWLSK